MATGIGMTKLEATGSNEMMVAVYRVEFSLLDAEGTMGFLPQAQAREPRSYTKGLIAVDVPVEHTTEAEVFAKAREILHGALTRLAEKAKAPA